MKRNKDKKGFTIIELLVVVVIISMLVAFVAPKMFKGLGKQKAKISRAKMAMIESAIGKFQLECGRLPDDSLGLEELRILPADMEDKWGGPYLKKSDLLDPWDNPYVYVQEGEINPGSFDLISFGADSLEGGEGDNADIYND
jgi:general secretion pathway protein G